MQNDSFWDEFAIPYQEEDEEFQFANPVIVAQHFIKAVGTAAYLGKQSEILTEQIGNLEVQLERKQRELSRFRRDILSRHYKSIRSSDSSEVREAFIKNKAEEDQVGDQLKDLEKEIERLQQELEIRIPRLDQYKTRLKVLETSMNWSKQYLDFDKLVIRSTNYSNQ